jgi:glycosyltransferase involved in cell wall biosynthesis
MSIPVIVADLPDGASIGRHEFRRLAAESLKDSVTTFRPDLVHSHVPLTNLLCNRVLPALGTPWITTVHGSYRQFAHAPITVSKPYLKPYLLLRHAIGDFVTTRSATRVVAVSDYIKRELQSIAVPPQKIRTVLNGLPESVAAIPKLEARQLLNIPNDAFVIGAMGYFAPVKGFDVLIRAFAELQTNYPSLYLLIAGGDILGDTSVRLSLEKLIADLCPGGRARLLDTLDPKAGFLSALDIFAVSSRTESFSLGLAEAMQYGKPGVVTSAGGCVEVARPGKEGLVFQSGSVRALAAQIERLILDSRLRESLGRAAQVRASTCLTLHRCTDEYEAVYREAVRKPQS